MFSLTTINQKLKDEYGLHDDARPNWRVTWSPVQTEKRLGEYVDHTSEGVFIRRVTEVREVPKYPHIPAMWILEALTAVPAVNQVELGNIKLSYECIYVFKGPNGERLDPRFDVAKLVIDTVYEQVGKIKVEKDPEATDPIGAKDDRVDKLVDELWNGDQPLGDTVVGYTGVEYGKASNGSSGS
jgi:hypothetical protein